MGEKTKIEWSDASLNFYLGCQKVSPGCKNCYAERVMKRMGRKYDFNVLHKTNWENIIKMLMKLPPSRIFANSMTDMFSEKLNDQEILDMIHVLKQFPQHQFLILTKRIERASQFVNDYGLAENIWLGTSIENKQTRDKRLPVLRNIKNVAIKFISFEPLLEDITPVDLTHIDWTIVGGESGSGFRPFDIDWARKIRIECTKQNVAFFFKQVGGFRPTDGGRLLDGKTYDEIPVLRWKT
jgi:protein gp37